MAILVETRPANAGDSEAAARTRWRVSRVAIYALLCLFALLYVVPAAIVVLNSFRNYPEIARHGIIGWPEHWSLEAWDEAWNRFCVSGMCDGIKWNFFNSLRIALPPTIVATLFGALNGYVLSQWKFRGADWVYGGMLLGVFMPPQLSLLPWAWVMGRLHLADSVGGLILIHCVQGLSFSTLLCRNFYAGIPTDLVKAAHVDGAGFWRIFVRIMLPLSTPILIVTVIWEFTSVWNEFLYGVVFTSGREQPVTAALLSVGGGGQSAAVLIAALPPMLIYLLGGRYFVRGLTQGAVK